MIIAGTAAFVLLLKLGATPLWDDDEPKNAACSVAMLESNDWVVPTFDGRLRVEKPPFVNWLHLAGMSIFGPTETGVRLGSAVLTIGTCLLTWHIGVQFFSQTIGFVAGLVMATCIWTGVGGRASTPDAPLVFFTTLTFFLFFKESLGNRLQQKGDYIRFSKCGAMAIGAVCGLAVLTKGPIGFVIPSMAMLVFALIRAWSVPKSSLLHVLTQLKPFTILASMLVVALPWYVWVTIRTNGEWLKEFLLVHNVGRFVQPMEGHSGSILYYPTIIAIGLFPWSLVLIATVIHWVALIRLRTHRYHPAIQLISCWVVTWIIFLSLAGTKLPGYIWPAYPALALATGCFFDAWKRGKLFWLSSWKRDLHRLHDLIMQTGFAVVFFTGLALSIALPIASLYWCPGTEWIGIIGLVPILGAVFGWRLTLLRQRHRVITTTAFIGGFLSLLLSVIVAPQIGHIATPKALLHSMEKGNLSHTSMASFRNTPPSLVFYSGGPVTKLQTQFDVKRHLTSRKDASLIVDRRKFHLLSRSIPKSHGIVSEANTVSSRHLILIGPVDEDEIAPHDGIHDSAITWLTQFQ